jgi:hypothetical protein
MSLRDLFESLDMDDYCEFSRIKNAVMLMLDRSMIMCPSSKNLYEIMSKHQIDINMMTSKEGLNMLMVICLWEPTFSGIAKEWITIMVENGLDLTHCDIKGKSTKEYLKEYMKK